METLSNEQFHFNKGNPMNNNQKIKTGRGGKRANAGRRKGSFEKLRASKLMHAIHKTILK